MNYESSYYEREPIYQTKPRRSKNPFGVIFAIVIIFIAGVSVGSVINDDMTSSKLQYLEQHVQAIEEEKSASPLPTITYTLDNTSLSSIYEAAKDSIVVIYCQVPQMTFFGTQLAEVQGSGFVYEYKNTPVVITNYHVISNAQDITVSFSNGNIYPASLLGSDPYSDLAVLSVDASLKHVKPLDIVSSSSLKVGDPVVAIGSPFGLGGTMTTGIVSQLARTIQESLAGKFPIANIIQTSAPINPGNSGGPLLNYQCQVIGITTAIVDNSEGLGFAIPSNTILREIGSLVENGSYTNHPWIGVTGTDMDYAIAEAMNVNITYGWLVSSVVENGAAAKGGLIGGKERVQIENNLVMIGGDIIVAIDGKRIINGDALMSYLEGNAMPGQIIKVTVLRNNQYADMPITLQARPSSGT
jgi:S1-C subfamily serine protease